MLELLLCGTHFCTILAGKRTISKEIFLFEKARSKESGLTFKGNLHLWSPVLIVNLEKYIFLNKIFLPFLRLVFFPKSLPII
jgi:hypothetical protein